MKTFLSAACDRSVAATSATVALVVGTILALINYGDRIFIRGDMQPADWVKLAVTYLVPYCVATYGAARFAARQAGRKPDGPAAGPRS